MASLEQRFEDACATKKIPGVILQATDATGKFHYQRAFGPATPTKDMDLDATMILASCTKLLVTIAALQCVHQGLIKLDDEVASMLPELKDPEILTDFTEEGGNGKPILEKSKVAITLRHLLTHTSGLGHVAMHPLYKRWLTSQNKGPFKGDLDDSLLSNITIPLLYTPGTSWSYGVNLDWTGILIARLTNTSLESFMQKHIFDSLDINNLTFHQEQKPDVVKNLVKMTSREGQADAKYGMPSRDGGAIKWSDEIIYQTPTKDEAGGGGMLGSPVSYLKVMKSILANDGVLLPPSLVEEMFTSQLKDAQKAALMGFLGMPVFEDGFSFPPLGTKMSFGIGGMLFESDVKETGKKAGTLAWSGLPNLYWSIDREVGLACMYAGNVIPFGDFKSGEMQRLFEKGMYERYAEFVKK